MALTEDGLTVVDETDSQAHDGAEAEGTVSERAVDGELQNLRDAFVEAFNARDLEAVTAIVQPDVECPDIGGDGVDVLAEELQAIWERSPGAILTGGFMDGVPCAVGWLPDEDGCWSRAALVCFDHDDGLLNLVSLPEDADTLERVEVEEPTGEELDEWQDWSEWDRGEETVARPRDRARP
jgi:hypothetical protein